MKWSFFTGAAILAGYFLYSNGAPAASVAVGIALAAAVTYWKSRPSA